MESAKTTKFPPPLPPQPNYDLELKGLTHAELEALGNIFGSIIGPVGETRKFTDKIYEAIRAVIPYNPHKYHLGWSKLSLTLPDDLPK